MKIVHVYNWLDPTNGGPPYVIAALVACQIAAGHQVTLVSSDRADARAVDEFFERYMARMPARSVVRPKFVLPVRTLPALYRALRDADVAHLHGIWPPAAMLASQVCRALSVPYVLSPHGSLHQSAMDEKSFKKRVGRRLGWGRMVERAAALHALNEDEAQGVAWTTRARIEVIPNGVFPEEFAERPQPGAFRRTVEGLGHAPYVLFLSRMHWGKGCDLLGEAFGRVAAVRPDVHLVACGPDQGGRALFEAAAARHNYSDRLHLFGRTDAPEKYAAMCDASVYCLPSRHEGFSMAITEAMAWGCPVVITDMCHFPEAGRSGGAIITPTEPEAIAGGLLTMLDDWRTAREMASMGRDMVLSRYTWPAISRRMLELYESVV